jgi:hypothetical protein
MTQPIDASDFLIEEHKTFPMFGDKIEYKESKIELLESAASVCRCEGQDDEADAVDAAIEFIRRMAR